MYFKNKKSKAQTSVEFLVIFAILFALFSYGIYITVEKSSTISEKEKIVSAQLLGINLGNIINQLSQSNNGFEKVFFMDSKSDFNVSINNYRLYIIDLKTQGYFDYPIYTNDVNILTTNFNALKITKENNYIVIRNA